MFNGRLTVQIKQFYKLFIAPPKQWWLPKKSEILIYDASGSELLAPYVFQYGVEVLAIHGEFVNIPCLLHATLSFEFWRFKPVQAYCNAFIRAVSPKIIITLIDNSINFYTISGNFPEIKTIFWQNGVRGGPGDIFASINNTKKYHVDHMLVFSQHVGKEYQRYISGEIIVAGSLKNNSRNISTDVVDESILFISQFREKPASGKAFFIDVNGVDIPWEKIYRPEMLALKFLKMWCANNKKLLRIGGCMGKAQGAEQTFFANHLNGCNWEYVPKTEDYGSYELLDRAEIVVGIDSTLVLESIGRGKKTAVFSCRSAVLNDASMKFGWPAALPDNGPFWTNGTDDLEFLRVMDYLSAVGVEEWELTRQTYASELIGFDPGNMQFRALLARLL